MKPASSPRRTRKKAKKSKATGPQGKRSVPPDGPGPGVAGIITFKQGDQEKTLLALTPEQMFVDEVLRGQLLPEVAKRQRQYMSEWLLQHPSPKSPPPGPFGAVRCTWRRSPQRNQPPDG